MGSLDKYIIDLKGMQGDSAEYEFLLDDSFFSEVNASEVHKGKLQASLWVERTSRAFDLRFHIEGVVCVLCDRCLDDMELPIVVDNQLCVKLGSEYVDDGDELIVVPEDEGSINVAWFMYEFIALSVPMRHVHSLGECNKAMDSQLRKYLCSASNDEFLSESDWDESGEDTKTIIDPRWNELKKLLDNN